MHLGEKIAHERKKLGLTQEELAVKTAFSLDLIRGFESGEKVPRIFALKIIAQVLEQDADYFLEDARELIAQDVAKQLEAETGFLGRLNARCWWFVLIPAFHLLIAVSMLRQQKDLDVPALLAARKIVRIQLYWTVCFLTAIGGLLIYHLLFVNDLIGRYPLSWYWVVLIAFAINAGILIYQKIQISSMRRAGSIRI